MARNSMPRDKMKKRCFRTGKARYVVESQGLESDTSLQLYKLYDQKITLTSASQGRAILKR